MVSLFLQKRRAYPELCKNHDGLGALLLTPRLDAQTSFVAPALLPLLLLVARRCSNSQGRDPRTREVLRWAVRVAPNSQGRGPSTPSATLVAQQLGDGPVALLMQTARGGDPRTAAPT